MNPFKPEDDCETCYGEFSLQCEDPKHRKLYEILRDGLFDRWTGDPLQELRGGAFRQAYLSPCGNFVYKVPRDSAGLRHNLIEADYANRRYPHWGDIVPAKCKMSPSGILVMERLYLPYLDKLVALDFYKSDPTSIPRWVHKVEGMQVGKRKDGTIAAYDYALDC